MGLPDEAVADSKKALELNSDVWPGPIARATGFGTTLALRRVAMIRIDREAAMRKITTRGFTLQEVLIMAAMNLLENAASNSKPEKKALQKLQSNQGWN